MWWKKDTDVFTVAKTYISDHPEIIYKGVPLAAACYILSPVLVLTWQYLPWLWAVYEIYSRLPTGSVSAVYALITRYRYIFGM